jgi:putative endonuclease
MPSPSQQQGMVAQQQAVVYLQQQGLAVVASNQNFKVGELDLIMQDGNALVFVEVRARSSAAFGGALASVNASKQTKLRKAAQKYLQVTYGSRQWPACRFDVVCVQGKDKSDIQWIKAAF